MATSYEAPKTIGINPLANPRVFWRVSTVGIILVALVGFLINAIGGNNAYFFEDTAMEQILVFDWTHNVVHVVLAVIGIIFGYTSVTWHTAANAAKVVGIVYLALGVLGFIPAVVDGLESSFALHLEVGENLLHILIGAWGTFAGFARP